MKILSYLLICLSFLCIGCGSTQQQIYSLGQKQTSTKGMSPEKIHELFREKGIDISHYSSSKNNSQEQKKEIVTEAVTQWFYARYYIAESEDSIRALDVRNEQLTSHIEEAKKQLSKKISDQEKMKLTQDLERYEETVAENTKDIKSHQEMIKHQSKIGGTHPDDVFKVLVKIGRSEDYLHDALKQATENLKAKGLEFEEDSEYIFANHLKGYNS